MLVWFAAARGIGQRMPKTHRNATAQLFCCPIEGGFRSVPPQISNVAKHSSTGGETEFQKSDNKHHKTQQIAWCYHTDRVELHVGLCLLAMCTLDLEPAFSLRKFKKKKTTSLIMLPPPHLWVKQNSTWWFIQQKILFGYVAATGSPWSPSNPNTSLVSRKKHVGQVAHWSHFSPASFSYRQVLVRS